MTVASAARRVYRLVRRPISVGAVALVVDGEGRVLLVRQSYAGRRWMLPGGGVKRNETMLDAALREVQEEGGVTAIAPDKVQLLGIYANFRQGMSDHIAVYVIKEWEQEPIHDLEISNAGFFAPDDLPQPLSGGTRRRIDEYLGRRDIAAHW
ncbi:MAG: NUDIX domain-containing protein [Actinobacteria bacterium]|nr:NUDIX domain-containing protein [Actinomycetota bacterium]